MNPQDLRQDGKSACSRSRGTRCLAQSSSHTHVLSPIGSLYTVTYLSADSTKPASSGSQRQNVPSGLLIPKHRSSGNLVAHASNSANFQADAQSRLGRLSVDAGTEYDLARCVQTIEVGVVKVAMRL